MQDTAMDGIMGFLMHPGTSGVLILLIFLGIYYELQSPGFGLPTVVALVAAALYFAPLYLEGLAANWEILLFIVGVILVLVELFAIPGFGIVGITGIVVVFISLVLALVRNVSFDFSYSAPGDLGMAAMRVVVSLGAFIVFLLFFGASFFRSKLFKRMVLTDDLADSKANTITINPDNPLIGMQGECFDNLRPQGKIKIGEKIFAATSLGEYIERGSLVIVLKEQGGLLVVRKVE
ncbi:MAG: hypothetical protein F9K23_09160 [Bacteroidetes bacterium]|nr:MAG: hypothetical protein F9K23_09160 [Bacteroidota bacterium]